MSGPEHEREYQRFNVHHRLQHVLLFSSFLVLAATGLPIKYSYSPWARYVVGVFGGFESMFNLHLAGAAVMILCSVYHLVYLGVMAVKGRWSLATLPNPRDFQDLKQNLGYFLGLTDEPARFERYSYKEKFDYWAVFWGMFIMVGSGLMMWFPDLAATALPGWVIDAGRIAHSDEAMLAILAIFVWHFYNVHLNPDFFPMSPVWFTGRLSRRLMEHEHPRELERLGDGPTAAGAAAAGGHAGPEVRPSLLPRALATPGQRRRLLLVEMVVYAAVLIWFLFNFLPAGLS